MLSDTLVSDQVFYILFGQFIKKNTLEYTSPLLSSSPHQLEASGVGERLIGPRSLGRSARASWSRSEGGRGGEEVGWPRPQPRRASWPQAALPALLPDLVSLLRSVEPSAHSPGWLLLAHRATARSWVGMRWHSVGPILSGGAVAAATSTPGFPGSSGAVDWRCEGQQQRRVVMGGGRWGGDMAPQQFEGQ